MSKINIIIRNVINYCVIVLGCCVYLYVWLTCKARYAHCYGWGTPLEKLPVLLVVFYFSVSEYLFFHFLRSLAAMAWCYILYVISHVVAQTKDFWCCTPCWAELSRPLSARWVQHGLHTQRVIRTLLRACVQGTQNGVSYASLIRRHELSIYWKSLVPFYPVFRQVSKTKTPMFHFNTRSHFVSLKCSHDFKFCPCRKQKYGSVVFANWERRWGTFDWPFSRLLVCFFSSKWIFWFFFFFFLGGGVHVHDS